MANGNGTKTRNIIYIIVSAAILLGMLATVAKTYFILPEQVKTHDITSKKAWEANKEEHVEMKPDIHMNEGECQSLSMDIVEIKSDIKYIRAEQQEQKIISKEILAELRK